MDWNVVASANGGYGNAAVVADYKLPAPGTYTIVCRAGDWRNTFDYTLSMVRNLGHPGAEKDEGSVPITSGALLSGTIDGCDQDAYTLVGHAGDILTVVLSPSGNGHGPQLELRDGGWNVVASANGGYGNAAVVADFRLPAAGSYTIVCRAGDWRNAFSYTLSMVKGLGSPGAEKDEGSVPIASGASVSGTIDSCDLDAYTFSGAAGDIFTAVLAPSGNGHGPQLELRDSDWELVVGTNGGYGSPAVIADFRLTSTGTHTIVCRAGDWRNAFGYTLTFNLRSTAQRRPHLVLQGRSNAHFAGPGGTARLTLGYANDGQAAASQVGIAVTLPGGLSPVMDSLGEGGTYDEGTRTLSWGLANLPAQSSRGEVGAAVIVSADVAEDTQLTLSSRLTCAELGEPATAQVVLVAGLPRVSSFTPNAGGAAGQVTVALNGSHLDPLASVALTRLGETNIVGTRVQGLPEGTPLFSTFDLEGRTPGEWTLTVANPGGEVATGPAPFVVQTSGDSKISMSLVVPGQISRRLNPPFDLVVGNSGSVNAEGVVVRVDFTQGDQSPVSRTRRFLLGSIPAGRHIRIRMSDVVGSFGTGPLSIAAQLSHGVPLYDRLRSTLLTLCQADTPSKESAVAKAVDETFRRSVEQRTFGYHSVDSASAVLLDAIVASGAAPPGAMDFTQISTVLVTVVDDPGNCKGRNSTSANCNVSEPKDPNGKAGPVGTGTGHYLPAGAPMAYTVFFENDPEKAEVPAVDVVIGDTLDAELDWTTLAVEEVGVGSVSRALPLGTRDTSAVLDLRPGVAALVNFESHFDPQSGRLELRLHGRDPEAEGPAGFLPPNRPDLAGAGQGWVSYTVMAKADLPTGAVVTNQASIVFDDNPSVDTPEWRNTIDAGLPTSRVAALPTTCTSPFTVRWSGEDDSAGSGVSTYTVYVSDNGGAYSPWLRDSPDTSGSFAGEIGHTYAFYSLATDQVGLTELATAVDGAVPAHATTSVVRTNHAPAKPSVALALSPMPTARVSAVDPDGDPVHCELEFMQGGAVKASVESDQVASGAQSAITVAVTQALGPGEWTWRAVAVDSDGARGESSSGTFTLTLGPGDLDGNGSVTLADAVKALRIALHMDPVVPAWLTAVDLSGNGTVDIADVVRILRLALGLK